MEYKVGDVVRIRTDLLGDYSYSDEDFPRLRLLCNHSMASMGGQIKKIKEVIMQSSRYPRMYIFEGGDGWHWSKEMIQPCKNTISYYLNRRE